MSWSSTWLARVTRWRASLLALVIANAIPLVGVLAFGWDLYGVMVTYWAENAIIGFYNALKMLRVGGASGIGYTAFFCVHYGAFMFVHFVFVRQLFDPDLGRWSDLFPSLHEVIAAVTPVAGAVIGSFISHGVSFYVNFVRGSESKGVEVEDLMSAPYQRVVILHVTIIAAGWLVMAAGTPLGALVLLVVLKTIVDAWAHIRERRRALPPDPEDQYKL